MLHYIILADTVLRTNEYNYGFRRCLAVIKLILRSGFFYILIVAAFDRRTDYPFFSPKHVNAIRSGP